jgi:hypothetical protein
MSEPHDRFRASLPPKAELTQVPLNQTGGLVCAWKGCQQMAPYPNALGTVFPLPRGWVCLMIRDNEDVELRDAGLCPVHSLKLSQLTKLPWV